MTEPPPGPRLVDDSILERLLIHLHAFRPDGLNDHRDIVRAWLESTRPGTELRRYCADEAGLLDAAADRLNNAGDEELQEMGQELGRAADRLRRLVGVP